jgi:putative ABC transport system ATP-binding protein
MNSPELVENLVKGLVEAKNVTKKVDTQEGELIILHPINMSVVAGESIAITGASGSGKSTLLGILAGLDVPTSGEVIIQDQIITQMDEEGRAKVRADHVGFIFQSFQLLPGLTALENVMLPLELRGDKYAKQKAENFLTRVGLVQRFQHYPQQLSGGEQQRVAIARAFACEPKILFADEPTGNLDSVTGEKIIDLLFDLNSSQGTTLILITHEERLAKRCSRRIELAAGALVSPELVL